MFISLLPLYQALIDSSYSLLPEAMAPIGQYLSFGSGFFRLKCLLMYLLHSSYPIISLEIYARYVAVFSIALM